LPDFVSLSVRGVFFVRVVERWRPLIFILVSIHHLVIDDLLDHQPVGNESHTEPLPGPSFLSEMLRMKSLRLEIQVLTFVLKLVSNVVPCVEVVRFKEVL